MCGVLKVGQRAKAFPPLSVSVVSKDKTAAEGQIGFISEGRERTQPKKCPSHAAHTGALNTSGQFITLFLKRPIQANIFCFPYPLWSKEHFFQLSFSPAHLQGHFPIDREAKAPDERTYQSLIKSSAAFLAQATDTRVRGCVLCVINSAPPTKGGPPSKISMSAKASKENNDDDEGNNAQNARFAP